MSGSLRKMALDLKKGFSSMGGHARLGAEHHAVAYLDVSGHAHLSAEHAPFAHLRRACHACLCGHHGVGSDFIVVGNLHQVVQLHALADDGGAHRGAVHARVGTYLHIVLQDGDAYLGNLLIALRGGGEAEPVGAHDAPRVQGAAVADAAVVV